MADFQPIIKWTGSKRSQSSEIVSHFPDEIDTYYEPFCGGCSVARALMESGKKVNRYVLSDNNKDLISLLGLVENAPDQLVDHYASLWEQMKSLESVSDKKRFYEGIRAKFNRERNPLDFMFLNRTCFNGMIRYNGKDEFNSPYHLNRDGMTPDKLSAIVHEWSRLFRNNNTRFWNADYRFITPTKDDFVYFDPPYANTKALYQGGFDNKAFLEFMLGLKCCYVFSYDGMSGNKDHTVDVPKELYDEHIYIYSGVSSFKRIKEVDSQAIVKESLYIKNSL